MLMLKVTETARLSPHRSVPLLTAFHMAPQPPTKDDQDHEHGQRHSAPDGDRSRRRQP
jgi:hypothetical protein